MEGMSAVGFVFGVFGLVAFVRPEKLTRELKAKGILDNDYEENCPPYAQRRGRRQDLGDKEHPGARAGCSIHPSHSRTQISVCADLDKV